MKKICLEEDGTWPGTVRQLLGSRKTTPAMLGFIAATRAGQRFMGRELEQAKEESGRNEASVLEEERMKSNEEEYRGLWGEERERGGKAG